MDSVNDISSRGGCGCVVVHMVNSEYVCDRTVKSSYPLLARWRTGSRVGSYEERSVTGTSYLHACNEEIRFIFIVHHCINLCFLA